MFLSSLIEDLCTKEENNKASCTLTFVEQCNKIIFLSKELRIHQLEDCFMRLLVEETLQNGAWFKSVRTLRVYLWIDFSG